MAASQVCKTTGVTARLHCPCMLRLHLGYVGSSRQRFRTAAAAQAEAGSVESIKQRVAQLSGSLYGHDLSDDVHQVIAQTVQQLQQIGPKPVPSVNKLTGTEWELLYTTSTGTSSGKVGPFITKVRQVFPADAPGVYFNTSELGLIKAQLRGEYEVSSKDACRINLEFKDLALFIGPFQVVKKEFEPGAMRGHWSMRYLDDDFRAFDTNQGNLFVLRRV